DGELLRLLDAAADLEVAQLEAFLRGFELVEGGDETILRADALGDVLHDADERGHVSPLVEDRRLRDIGDERSGWRVAAPVARHDRPAARALVVGFAKSRLKRRVVD